MKSLLEPLDFKSSNDSKNNTIAVFENNQSDKNYTNKNSTNLFYEKGSCLVELLHTKGEISKGLLARLICYNGQNTNEKIHKLEF